MLVGSQGMRARSCSLRRRWKALAGSGLGTKGRMGGVGGMYVGFSDGLEDCAGVESVVDAGEADEVEMLELEGSVVRYVKPEAAESLLGCSV